MSDDALSDTGLIRVGIILPEDGAEQVRLQLPDCEYTVTGGAEPKRLRSAAVEARTMGSAVRLTLGGEDAGSADTWHLAPAAPAAAPDDPNALQRPGIVVSGITAGRGFHWQTVTSQSLPGTLTLRNQDGHLLLATAMPLEEYLAGVITAEMSGQAPLEFLKSQCVVARSWTLAGSERKHADLGLDYCNDDCCQRYQGNAALTESACLAVAQTYGVVLQAENGQTVDANYSKSCGGIVEASEPVWGFAKPGLSPLVDAPPLTGRPGHHHTARFHPVTDVNVVEYVTGGWLGNCDAFCSPNRVPEADLPRYLGRVDRGGGFFRWKVSYGRAELEEIIRQKCTPDSPLSALAVLENIEITQRGISGRATALSIAYRDSENSTSQVQITGEYEIRKLLHQSFLYSSAFHVVVHRDSDGSAQQFDLCGAGWGHGTGLCQIGALGMAIAGYKHRRILNHYFPTAQLASRSPAAR